MSGVFDSVGLSLAFAGVMILLAGLFLTPMREMVLNGLRSRFEHEIALPPVTMQMPPVPRRIPPAPVHMPSPPIEMATAPIQMSSGAQPAWAHAAAADTPADAATAAREQEALFARALVTAHKTAEDLVRRANAEAQDIIDKAQAAANDIVGSARRSASELLQKAEQEAQLISRTPTREQQTAWRCCRPKSNGSSTRRTRRFKRPSSPSSKTWHRCCRGWTR